MSDELSRSDLSLVRQSLRQDWGAPAAVKTRILQRLIDYLDRETLEGATCSDRQAIAAAKTLVEFMKLTIDQQRIDLGRDRFEAERPAPQENERPPRIRIPASPGAKGPKSRSKAKGRDRKR